MTRLESITAENFKAYGTVLEFPENYGDTFYIVDTETDQPWRVAVFRYSSKEIKVVENHPTSKESFEPLKGITVLLVAEHENPEDYRAFVLDKPGVVAIPRTGSALHAQENAAAAAIVLTDEDRRQLDEAFPPPREKAWLDIV